MRQGWSIEGKVGKVEESTVDTRRSWLLAYFRLGLLGLLAAWGCGGESGGSALGQGPADCVDGKADGYPCKNVSLARHVSLSTLKGNSGNDIWGWIDPGDGTEYVLMGLDNGTAFLRVSDPENPVLVGRLPTQTRSSTWRDIKVYMNHAFIVADSAGAHGMQVFDLTRLIMGGTDQRFEADTVYASFDSAHNIAIDESSGFAYVVGSETCSGGLHIVNISDPLNPFSAGCHGTEGDVHDAQCVRYAGPDTDYTDAEICFNASETSIAIVDVSDKSATQTLAVLSYSNLGFTHQAWLDDSHQYLVVNDEADEIEFEKNTATIVIDVRVLNAPIHLYTHQHQTRSIDHNLFVRGNRIYEANYTAGLRILEFSDLASDTLREVAFFDTYPENNDRRFDGAWGVYPFFPSGIIAVSDVDRGLFIVIPE